VQLLAVAVLVAGTAAAVGLRLALAGGADRVVTPRQPELVYRPVGGLALGAHGVFAVAHNSGDTTATARRAVAYGAQVVEIDVVASRGRLGIAHDRPLPLTYGVLRLRSVGIEPVWRIARGAPVVELDLKQSSPLFVEALVAFLRTHRDADVLVATPHAATLRALRARTPWVRRYVSITGRVALERVLHDPLLDGLAQGVSVRHDLLDGPTTRRLKAHGLTILAWVVDDPRRVAQLVRFGVDGITTDNLALVELLARRQLPNALSPSPARSGAR
jgi:hypothetical protein